MILRELASRELDPPSEPPVPVIEPVVNNVPVGEQLLVSCYAELYLYRPDGPRVCLHTEEPRLRHTVSPRLHLAPHDPDLVVWNDVLWSLSSKQPIRPAVVDHLCPTDPTINFRQSHLPDGGCDLQLVEDGVPGRNLGLQEMIAWKGRDRRAEQVLAVAVSPLNADLIGVATGSNTCPSFVLCNWRLRRRLSLVVSESGQQAQDVRLDFLKFELSPHDPDLFMVCTADAVTLCRWSASSDRVVHRIRQACDDARLSPIDPDVVALCTRHTLTIWRWSTQKFVTLTEHNSPIIKSLAFSPNDGDLIATADSEGIVHVWSISRRQSVAVLDVKCDSDETSVQSLAFVFKSRNTLTKGAR
mmetsp:Transcript_26988/g.58572  ORF Transcript_26988/g.58572 Transcript_26988/m.58572 type:complete len:357 (-) Transcript_26988:1049-2119(-)